jgi:hypothetical protein
LTLPGWHRGEDDSIRICWITAELGADEAPIPSHEKWPSDLELLADEIGFTKVSLR